MVVRDSRSSRIKEVVIERHTKNHETKKTALIALYVDDTTIAAGSIGEMKKKAKRTPDGRVQDKRHGTSQLLVGNRIKVRHKTETITMN